MLTTNPNDKSQGVAEDKQNSIAINGKEVDYSSLEVDGVDSRDYPDFSDAYFSSGYFTDGTPMSDEDLDQLTNTYGEMLYDKAYDSLHEASQAVDEYMNRRRFLKGAGAGVAAAGIAGVGLGVGAASGASKPIEIEGRWHYKLMQFKPEYATKAEIKKSPDGTKVYTWKRPNLKNPGTFNYYYYPITEEGLAEEQLNELDFFAPVTTFIKMTDGSYIQADWRKSQGNPGLSDSASFVNFKPVNPNVAKQLGLDSYQRNNSISNHRDGTIVPGGPIQGSGPLANRGYEVVDYNKPETMKELPPEIKSELIKWVQTQSVVEESCPHCGGEMVSEELMNEKKDACYYKVKSRYKVWPSAYASGALVKCRNKGASNWGNGGKKNESSILEGINRADESLHDWFNKEKWVRMDTKGNIKGPCAKEPGEGKPKCLPQSKAHSLGKKGRASAAQRKRREDPNPERSGKAINVDTKKSKG